MWFRDVFQDFDFLILRNALYVRTQNQVWNEWQREHTKDEWFFQWQLTLFSVVVRRGLNLRWWAHTKAWWFFQWQLTLLRCCSTWAESVSEILLGSRTNWSVLWELAEPNVRLRPPLAWHIEVHLGCTHSFFCDFNTGKNSLSFFHWQKIY